jgi:tetratricopeptide (TPR) repeat protein
MAEQTSPVRRRVALKVIKLGMDTRQVIARFEAERQALAMMDHPNIAKVFDAGTTETGRPYFVMELVRGIPITAYCDQHQLTPRQRLEVFIQVCQAVQHAHQKGIIHRDLKPTNVLITLQDGDKPTPKVIDFGIAKATVGQRLTELTLFTEFRQFIGTPLYMSPEQAEMSAVMDIDTRSDVYALGVLLYELLTGTTPFEKDRLAKAAYDEVRRIIREEDPPRPSTRLSSLAAQALTTVSAQRHMDPKRLGQTVRGELDWIVMRALEKDRTRRYETVNGFLRDIQRYLTDQPVEACSPSKLYRLRKLARRNKPAIVTGAVIAAVLVLATVISAGQAVRAKRAEVVALRAQERALSAKEESDETAAFMKDMLKGVGPSAALGRDTTMLREILDQTAKRLDTLRELKNEPLAEADLRATLGNVYCDLGEYPKAQAMLSQALEMRKRLLTPEHPLLAQSLNDLGEAFRRQGKFVQAEALHRQALAMRKGLFGNRHPDVATSLNNLAESLRRQDRQARGKAQEAEPLFREALAIRRELYGDKNLEVAQTLHDLGRCLSQRIYHPEPAAAEVMQREALAIRQELLGPENPDVAESLAALGLALGVQGKYAEEESAHRAALAMRRKLLGNKHPDVAHSLYNLAGVLAKRHQFAEAEAMQREVLAIRRESLGPENVDTALSLERLSNIVRQQGRLTEAEALLREALASYVKLRDYMGMSVTSRRLCGDLARQGKPAEILALRDSMRRDLPGDPTLLAAVYSPLIGAMADLGRPADVQDLCRELLELAPRNARELNSAAWSLATSAHPTREQAILAVEFAERALGVSPQDGDNWNTLGVARYRTGDWPKAIEALQKSRELQKDQKFSVDAFFLAMCYWRLGREDEARRWYDQAVLWMDKNQPHDEELRRFRAEAMSLMGEAPATNSSAPASRPASSTSAPDVPTFQPR